MKKTLVTAAILFSTLTSMAHATSETAAAHTPAGQAPKKTRTDPCLDLKQDKKKIEPTAAGKTESGKR